MSERFSNITDAVEVRYPEPDIEGIEGFRIIKKDPDIPPGSETFDRGSVRRYLKGVLRVAGTRGMRRTSTGGGPQKGERNFGHEDIMGAHHEVAPQFEDDQL